MGKLSSIGQVNFRKNQYEDGGLALDYTSAEHLIGKQQSGLLSLAGQQRQQFNISLEQANYPSEGPKTDDLNSTVAGRESYKKMIKNKDQYSKKVVVSDAYDAQPVRGNKIPTMYPGMRAS